MNCGAKSFRGSAPSEEAAMELAEEIAKSKKAEFYSWLQILDIVTGRYTEYSIKWGGVLEERDCPLR
jgi:aromatic ring-opening dioxygenase LigB subunit